ncbi:type I restriction endonuclease [Hyphomonas sp.]|uniref:type I restriction endonuclease subunit R n=1 Tax=Hyphomonas sp. TaxID=87 RepID=UPI0025C51AAB|nr:type I restriction endonuclease [Hyphomonas sp.]
MNLPNNIHKEVSFEREVCEHLKAHGWLHVEGDAGLYDRGLALLPSDVVAWVQASQPKAWDALFKSHGAAAQSTMCDRIRKQLDARGMLDMLRHGVEMIGLKQPLALAQFKPALAMNPDLMARYAANRLRIVRQVKYSQSSENCIDLVLFLNGLPVATVEFKTDFTQTVGDAIDQYREDRLPRSKTGAVEPLLNFPSGALVHFAVSNSEVHMATKLEGRATTFLPFNRGDDGGKGNPPNPKGHPTAYLWEEVWQRDSWLELLGRYVVAQRDKKKQIEKLIFPRYHQLDATRKLQAAVLKEGPGGKYLIQHSAGSGKTNSIAWSAHFLSEMHDAANAKLFDSVIVVSDRNVIDSQLQEALFDFQRITGVVATIKNEGDSKSGLLAKALSDGKKIIVCTIQTFPFALTAVQELAATQGKRFAVIADEAHSSQTGEAASKLKQVLSAEELKALEDGGEVSAEDILAAQMSARVKEQGITYVAFTATPKAKTLELFGRRPRPEEPAGPTNLPAPFHVYSMRQAIEEGFILDVLKNYTPYKLAFRLASGGEEWDETEVERSAAMKGIMRWVKLHPYNISQKVQIVVEHYRDMVAPLLSGKAKAMVVVSSRVEAVRWKLAIDSYIKGRGYRIGTLVAFSGEVNDKESGEGPFTEASKVLNPDLKGVDIREAFKSPDYHILLVANKFQTGFDQPLLCGMYVDRRLAGIQAVQTLSRLNRAYPGKEDTFVVDFVNSAEEVLEAFKTYYRTAELSSVTDPNIVFNLRAKLDASGHYDSFEVDRVVKVELNPKSKQGDLIAALTPVADRLLKQYKAAQDALTIARAKEDKDGVKAAQASIDALLLFRNDIGAFQRMYVFLSQIFDYGNTDIEKRHIFFKRLLPLLEFGREREGIDLSKVTLTHHALKDQGKRQLPLVEGESPKLEGMSETGSGGVYDKEKALLGEIISRVNELFDGGELTEGDKLSYVTSAIRGKMMENNTLRQQAASNTKEQFAQSPDLNTALINAIIDAYAAHENMSKQALNSEKIRQGLKDVLLGPAQLYEALRGAAAPPA